MARQSKFSEEFKTQILQEVEEAVVIATVVKKHSLDPKNIHDGRLLPDDLILQHLKNYRSDIHFMNTCGAKMLSHYLVSGHSIYVNHKKVYRLCKENNLLLFTANQLRTKIKKMRCEYRNVTAPNQLWQFDLKHVYIHGENAWCYLLSFIDVYTKKVVAYSLGKSIKAGQLILTLNLALVTESISREHPLQIRSD